MMKTLTLILVGLLIGPLLSDICGFPGICFVLIIIRLNWKGDY